MLPQISKAHEVYPIKIVPFHEGPHRRKDSESCSGDFVVEMETKCCVRAADENDREYDEIVQEKHLILEVEPHRPRIVKGLRREVDHALKHELGVLDDEDTTRDGNDREEESEVEHEDFI